MQMQTGSFPGGMGRARMLQMRLGQCPTGDGPPAGPGHVGVPPPAEGLAALSSRLRTVSLQEPAAADLEQETGRDGGCGPTPDSLSVPVDDERVKKRAASAPSSPFSRPTSAGGGAPRRGRGRALLLRERIAQFRLPGKKDDDGDTTFDDLTAAAAFRREDQPVRLLNIPQPPRPAADEPGEPSEARGSEDQVDNFDGSETGETAIPSRSGGAARFYSYAGRPWERDENENGDEENIEPGAVRGAVPSSYGIPFGDYSLNLD